MLAVKEVLLIGTEINWNYCQVRKAEVLFIMYIIIFEYERTIKM